MSISFTCLKMFRLTCEDHESGIVQKIGDEYKIFRGVVLKFHTFQNTPTFKKRKLK